MSISEDQIGRNLRSVRERLARISSQDLALRMRLRGWSWDAEVVQSIERGQRPLLRAEADDLVGALGYSDLLLSVTTDIEAEAEVADRYFVLAERDVRRAMEWWSEVASRYDAHKIPIATTILAVVDEGRRVHAHPDAVFGQPMLQEPVADTPALRLSEWVELAEYPKHPLDKIAVGVPWNDEQIRLQLDYDLREASMAVRHAVVQWLRANEVRAQYYQGEVPETPEELAERI